MSRKTACPSLIYRSLVTNSVLAIWSRSGIRWRIKGNVEVCSVRISSSSSCCNYHRASLSKLEENHFSLYDSQADRSSVPFLVYNFCRSLNWVEFLSGLLPILAIASAMLLLSSWTSGLLSNSSCSLYRRFLGACLLRRWFILYNISMFLVDEVPGI